MMKGPMYFSPAMRAGQARRDAQRWYGNLDVSDTTKMLNEHRAIMDDEKANREAGYLNSPADENEKQRPYMVAALETLLMKKENA